jgi:sterol desaturase/sphingolipid hydroxylase (fatty acid hydroxylase superfamily)
MTLVLILIVGIGCAGIAMGLFTWISHWASARQYLISPKAERHASDTKMIVSLTINTLVSLSLVFGLTLSLRHILFYDRPLPIRMMLLEGATVLLFYDFAYYFMHRYLFHQWSLLRSVHAVHHAAHHPRAVDSFLLHPVENLLGLTLLLASIATVGGIHIWTFAPIFAGYTTLNVLNHAGLNIPRFPFRTLGRVAIAHDKHHHSMSNGNYASITPLPDIIFGTFE